MKLKGWRTLILCVTGMVCSTVLLAMKSIEPGIWQTIFITSLGVWGGKEVSTNLLAPLSKPSKNPG